MCMRVPNVPKTSSINLSAIPLIPAVHELNFCRPCREDPNPNLKPVSMLQKLNSLTNAGNGATWTVAIFLLVLRRFNRHTLLFLPGIYTASPLRTRGLNIKICGAAFTLFKSSQGKSRVLRIGVQSVQ